MHKASKKELEYRRGILANSGKDNQAIVKKLDRRIRKVQG